MSIGQRRRFLCHTCYDGVLPGELIREVTGAESTEPGTELKNSYEPALRTRVACGGAHVVWGVEVGHTTKT